MMSDLFIGVLYNLHLFQEVPQSIEEVQAEPEHFRTNHRLQKNQANLLLYFFDDF
jgi:hypothetical protein